MPSIAKTNRSWPAAWLIAIMTVTSLGGCTDSFRVEAPYDWVWEQSMQALTAEGFEMVVVADARRLVPASNAATGRAWFLGAPSSSSGLREPRIIEITIEPVQPPEAVWRTITVKAEDRSWVARGNVPDPDMRNRVTWILRQALQAPGNPAPLNDDR